MKKLKYLLFTCCTVLLLSSCIKSEEPNSEADIEEFTFKEDKIINSVVIDNINVGNYGVMINVKEGSDITSLTPIITTTPGATIEPKAEIPQDFTTPVKYIITSEDKKWKKEYLINVFYAELPTHYSFESAKISDGKFYYFTEESEGNEILRWASGNSGYSIIGGFNPNEYPTIQDPKGHINKCAKLTTKDTGPFGHLVKMPIAAGNLFLGQFKSEIATSHPLQATLFGETFTKIPIAIKGWYKYSPTTYKLKGKEVMDEADIYAVLYENKERLNGTNILTDPSIIAIARPDYIEPKNNWTEFKYDFKTLDGKKINPIKAAKGLYKIAVVFTSSKDGADFKGGVDSTLHIDEVTIITK